MHRRLWIVARWPVLAAICIGIGPWLAPRLYRMLQRLAEGAAITHHHTGPTLEQLLPLSDLVTLRVQVTDALETRIHGFTGGITAAILIKGDAELSTDLSRAHFVEINEQDHTVVLSLPDPKVSQARLDHVKTRIVALYCNGLWMLVPGDTADRSVINQAYEEAQIAVAAAAEGEAIRDKARAQAEEVLGKFFEAMNWRVRVRWGDRP